MKIRKLQLFTNKLEKERQFYTEKLGFPCIALTPTSFTVKIGWSDLTFVQSDEAHIYHYCFLIPSNKLHEALVWMTKRTDILLNADGHQTTRFESWNADALYFYDASGNIAEFIVRHDLNNVSNHTFDNEQVLGINEIGLPTNNIPTTNKLLESSLGTSFWKGDVQRFGTNGDQQGLILLPNYSVKDTWFPTHKPLLPVPFEAQIEENDAMFNLLVDFDEVSIN